MDFLSTKVAFASQSLNDFISHVDAQIINPLIILLFVLALAFFLYGLFEFIANGANDEKKTTGKGHMLWGVVGLAIMMGVWSILTIIMNTLNIQGINPEQGTVNLPDYNPPTPNNLNQ